SRILLAAAIAPAEIDALFADRIVARDEVGFDPATASVRARSQRRLGALTLADRPQTVAPDAATARILAQGIVRLGIDRLPWTPALSQWRARVGFLRRVEGDEWPDLSDGALTATAADWLAPSLTGIVSLGELKADTFAAALQSLLPW